MSRILIAEDEEALCAMCARALTMDGHEVKTAADGSEALDMLTREEGRFDLLLTDVRMPIMDGIALALNVARDFPNTTILLMTGYADQRERAQGLDALIHDVITKPFTLAALRAAVNEALTVRRAADFSPDVSRMRCSARHASGIAPNSECVTIPGLQRITSCCSALRPGNAISRRPAPRRAAASARPSACRPVAENPARASPG